MMHQKKKIISHELYEAKKSKRPDHLCKMIREVKENEYGSELQLSEGLQQKLKKKVIEKRVKMILNNYHISKISPPEPYIKRTWVSPLNKNVGTGEEKIPTFKMKSREEKSEQDLKKMEQVCKVLDMNKKMHLFGEFMYCDFDGKQTTILQTSKNRESQLESLNRKYRKMIGHEQQKMVICNHSSNLNSKSFYNPLKHDKYYEKIMRKNDENLMKLLVTILSCPPDNNFTFSSYIEFYSIFIWQQATKTEQIEFVIKLLMGYQNEIMFAELNEKIDFICSKISLVNTNQSLVGFNDVLKKLIYGANYEYLGEADKYMTREELKFSFEINEECISIFINVFYAE